MLQKKVAQVRRVDSQKDANTLLADGWDLFGVTSKSGQAFSQGVFFVLVRYEGDEDPDFKG